LEKILSGENKGRALHPPEKQNVAAGFREKTNIGAGFIPPEKSVAEKINCRGGL